MDDQKGDMETAINYNETVQKQSHEVEEGGRKKKKILRAMVAIDDSKESFCALKWTLDKLFIQTAGTSTSPVAESTSESPPPLQAAEESGGLLLTLVHVMEPLPHYAYPGGYVVETTTKSQEQNAAKILSRASQLCKEKNVVAEMVAVEGDPKQMICQTAEKTGVEVVVVGSRGLGQIKRALLGSVSDYCAHHAKCPIIIVKLPQESQ